MTWLIHMTLTGSITAVLILTVKTLLKEKISAKWQVYIWAILLIRLLMPALPESAISVFNRVPSGTIQTERVDWTAPVRGEIQPFGSRSVQATEPAQKVSAALPAANAQRPIGLSDMLFYGWSSISALLLLYFAGVYFVFTRRVAKLKGDIDPEVLGLLEDCKRRLGVRGAIRVVTGGDMPLLKGIWKPVIVVPSGYDLYEIKDIFIHELCHYKHGDVLTLWGATVLLCLNWFNPIMWGCFFQFRKDIELACDERVLAVVQDRKQYAALLLKTALKQNRFLLGTTSMQNGEKEIAKRIKTIASVKKPKVYWSIIAFAAAVLVGVLCLTNAVSNKDQLQTDTQQIVGGYPVKLLLDNKTPYVGDNSKVGGIVSSLPVPDGAVRGTIELKTESEPYGIRVKYTVENPDEIIKNGVVDSLSFYKNAMVMFSLIENVGYIEFYLRNEGAIYPLVYTREMAQNDFQSEMGVFSKTQEEFMGFLKRVQDISEAPNQRVVLPAQIMEMLNQKGFALVNQDQIYKKIVVMKDNIIYQDPETGVKIDAATVLQQHGYLLKDVSGEQIAVYIYDAANSKEPTSSKKYIFASVFYDGKEMMTRPVQDDWQKQKIIDYIEQHVI